MTVAQKIEVERVATGERSTVQAPLRFCGAGCHDSYRSDREHRLVYCGFDFAAASQGCCSYCGCYVPTNTQRQQRAAGELVVTRAYATSTPRGYWPHRPPDQED